MNIKKWVTDLRTNPHKLVVWLIIISSVARIFIAAFTGLGIGESYYFRGAKEIDLAYYDQPPLFFWVGYISIKLLGISNFALRLPSILFFAGTCWILFKIASRLYNPVAGFWSVVILNLCLVFTVPVAVWFQPDAPLMFFWLLTCWLMIKIISLGEINSEKPIKTYTLWLLGGVSLGLTFLSKYHALFIPLAVGIFMLFNKQYRKWLWHPAPYLAILVFFVVVSPVIYWNWKNDWVSFSFQGSRAVGEFRLHPEWLLRSILGQIIWLAPWVFFPLITQLFSLARSARGNPVSSFLFVLSALPILFFTLISLWSNSKYHFHWQAPGYLMLMIPLGASIARYLENEKQKAGTIKWIKGSMIASLAVTFLLLLHTQTGILKKAAGLVNINNILVFDPTIEGYDYKDLRQRFEKEGWLDNDNLFVVSTVWWQTGKIDWALRGDKDILVLHHNPRNYTFYGENPRNLKGKDAILVRYMRNGDTTTFKRFFKNVERLDDIVVTRSGISELKLEAFYCRQFVLPGSPMTEYPAYNMMKGEKPYKKTRLK
jgi:hypothetical protein